MTNLEHLNNIIKSGDSAPAERIGQYYLKQLKTAQRRLDFLKNITILLDREMTQGSKDPIIFLRTIFQKAYENTIYYSIPFNPLDHEQTK